MHHSRNDLNWNTLALLHIKPGTASMTPLLPQYLLWTWEYHSICRRRPYVGARLTEWIWVAVEGTSASRLTKHLQPSQQPPQIPTMRWCWAQACDERCGGHALISMSVQYQQRFESQGSNLCNCLISDIFILPRVCLQEVETMRIFRGSLDYLKYLCNPLAYNPLQSRASDLYR